MSRSFDAAADAADAVAVVVAACRVFSLFSKNSLNATDPLNFQLEN